MTPMALALALGLFAPPEIQRPKSLGGGSPVVATEPATPPVETPPADVPPADVPPADGAPADAVAPGEAVEQATPEPPAVTSPETAPDKPTPAGEMVRVAEGNRQTRPPYYDEADLASVRTRHGLPAEMATDTRKARWRCLIADPTCGFNVEVNALASVAGRFKQGDVRQQKAKRWTSGRAQYDVWVNFPVLVESVGRARFTRMTLGPKVGAIFSDTGDTWGNLGVAGRYWLGRGRWAPTIEFSSGLAFKIARRPTSDLGGAKPHYDVYRGPVGVTADIGFGLGGFGALVFGAQYDSPLAREDVPERFRTSAAGMVFFGFRGNILWGGPAAAAALTHGVTQKYGREAR